MQEAGLIRSYDNDSVLWHWDLSPSNVLIWRQDSTLGGEVEDVACSNHGQEQNEPSEGCRHSFEFKVDRVVDQHCAKHTVNIDIEGHPGMPCSHNVEVTIKDLLGTTYRYTQSITEGKIKEGIAQVGNALKEVSRNSSEHQDEVQATQVQRSGNWVISGILDWDDVLAVPLVLSRKAPSWLWLHEDERPFAWSGNRDAKPHRDLVEDELLIKVHFDQVMARASPTYIEDAYGRGIWLRALARFAIYNFGKSVV